MNQTSMSTHMAKPPWELGPDEPLPISKTTIERGVKQKKDIPEDRQTPSGRRSFARKHLDGSAHGQSKYDPIYAEQLLEYFDVQNTSKTGEVITAKGTRITNALEGSDLPTTFGFCAMIGISRVTYHRWAHDVTEDGVPKYPDFPQANETIKCIQQDILISNGLKGKYNASLTKFLLNTQHEMIEKSSKDINVRGGIAIHIDKDDTEL